VGAQNPLRRIQIKFRRTARALRSWSKGIFGDLRFQLHLANEIILRLDVAQESRILSAQEFRLRKHLKVKVLGLAAIDKARRCQASRITWLRVGDANTRFFHAKMKARRRKNFIHVLHSESGILTSHEEKEAALHSHFDALLGTTARRSHTMAWEELQMPTLVETGLDLPFTAREVWDAIKDSPAEKAPGPDGFTGTFYRRCWPIIKHDVMAVFQHVYNIRGGDMAALNSAFVCLLPKKAAASRIGEYRPISLIHSLSKLFSKVLARRLTPLMNDIVSHAQSAFLKKRCLHDNFLFVRNLARAFHRKKKPALLFKLDFARAFDSVSWEYLLELLQHLGFSSRWRSWISLILSTASSAVLLNGAEGPLIRHRRGLRQGDPLSPLLFILAIDPLHRILDRATLLGYLSPLPLQEATLRASLYADDAAVFLNPARRDVQHLRHLLQGFTTSKTLIYGPIIYGALRFGAPQISSRGAPK
jgi:hypothetical protein